MKTKEESRRKRHRSIRKRISGSPERPRVTVHRSSKNLFVQVVDDTVSRTLCSFSTLDKAIRSEKKANKTQLAQKLGEQAAAQLKTKGIQKIAFDRGGYQYHGRIKALADSMRQGGIQF